MNELYAKLPISCEEDLASQLDEMFEKHHSHMLSNIHEKVNASAHVDTGTSVPSRLDFLQSVQGGSHVSEYRFQCGVRASLQFSGIVEQKELNIH